MKAFDAALGYLLRREHGAKELSDKLSKKGYSDSEIITTIAKCQRLGLQDDRRYIEMLCRTRIRQGYGPLKIRGELQGKQVDKALVHETLKAEDDNWLEHARAVFYKKYKNKPANGMAELQKQQRFLIYRGFPLDLILKISKEIEDNSLVL